MYITSKAQRAINNINAFLAKTEYPASKKISYESTKTSLRTYLAELNYLLYKEPRKKSHYVSCTEFVCKCSQDNLRIENIVSEVQRLLRGVS